MLLCAPLARFPAKAPPCTRGLLAQGTRAGSNGAQLWGTTQASDMCAPFLARKLPALLLNYRSGRSSGQSLHDAGTSNRVRSGTDLARLRPGNELRRPPLRQ